MKRPRIAEIEAVHDHVGRLLTSSGVGVDYYTLRGVYRTLQWVLGYDHHLVGPSFPSFDAFVGAKGKGRWIK